MLNTKNVHLIFDIRNWAVKKLGSVINCPVQRQTFAFNNNLKAMLVVGIWQRA